MEEQHKLWLAFIITWTSIYSIRTVFSPAIPEIIRELSLSYALVGLASAAIFYSYVIMQFVAGFLGAAFGRKRVLLAGMGVSGLATLLTSLAWNFYSLVAFRILTGIGHGLVFSNDRSIIAHSTSARSVGLGQGLSFSGVGLGLVIGVSLGGFLVASLGWRNTFLAMIASAVVAFVTVSFWVREPREVREDIKEVFSNVKSLLRNREYLAVILVGIPINYTLWVITTWLPTAISEAGVAGIASASSITALVGVAAPIGLITVGKLSDVAYSKRGSEWGVIFLMSALLAASTGLLTAEYALRSAIYFLIPTVFAAGFVTWGAFASIYRVASRTSLGPASPVAFGLMNGIHFVGALVSPYVTGYMRDVYADFTLGLALAALVPLVSLLGSLLVKGA